MESPISSLPPISSVLSPSPPTESSSDGTESTASSQPYDEDALDALMGRCEHLSARLAAYEREPAARPRGAATSSDEPGDSVASSITNDEFPAPEPVEMPPKKRQRRRRKGRKHARDAAGFEGRSP